MLAEPEERLLSVSEAEHDEFLELLEFMRFFGRVELESCCRDTGGGESADGEAAEESLAKAK